MPNALPLRSSPSPDAAHNLACWLLLPTAFTLAWWACGTKLALDLAAEPFAL